VNSDLQTKASCGFVICRIIEILQCIKFEIQNRRKLVSLTFYVIDLHISSTYVKLLDIAFCDMLWNLRRRFIYDMKQWTNYPRSTCIIINERRLRHVIVTLFQCGWERTVNATFSSLLCSRFILISCLHHVTFVSKNRARELAFGSWKPFSFGFWVFAKQTLTLVCCFELDLNRKLIKCICVSNNFPLLFCLRIEMKLIFRCQF